VDARVAIRPAGRGDLEAAYEILLDSHLLLHVEPRLTFGMFANLFGIGTGAVAESAGAIFGAAVLDRDEGHVWVRPAERRRGVGTRLLAWLEARASPGVVRFTAPAVDAAVPFLAANGYRKNGEVWLMGIELTAQPPPATWPDGVAVRSFVETDAAAVKELLDEAYAADPGYAPLPFSDWRTFMLRDPGYDPDVWLLALAGDEIVGAALTWKEGFVKDLVVSPRWRGRGIGTALMLQTFAAFHRRGIGHVTLKTDSANPTGARRLYERLGMATELTYQLLEKSV
jgi:mycothiol synthase